MKSKKGEIQAVMLAILIFTIIGTIVLGIVWGMITDQTSTTTKTDVAFTGSNSSCQALSTQWCIGSITQVANTTKVLTSGNYSLCAKSVTSGHYDGILLSSASNFLGNSLNANYTQVSCQQVTGVTATILNYVPLLLAVILLIGVAVYIK